MAASSNRFPQFDLCHDRKADSPYGSDIDAFESNYEDAIDSCSGNDDEVVYTGTRVPNFYEPQIRLGMPVSVPEDWTPDTFFNVYIIKSGKHRNVLEKCREKSNYLLSPKGFGPHDYNALIALRKEQYKRGQINLNQMLQACNDEKVFMEAVKYITDGGAVFVPRKGHVYYSTRMPQREVERLLASQSVPVLEMGPGPDYRWSFSTSR